MADDTTPTPALLPSVPPERIEHALGIIRDVDVRSAERLARFEAKAEAREQQADRRLDRLEQLVGDLAVTVQRQGEQLTSALTTLARSATVDADQSQQIAALAISQAELSRAYKAGGAAGAGAGALLAMAVEFGPHIVKLLLG